MEKSCFSSLLCPQLWIVTRYCIKLKAKRATFYFLQYLKWDIVMLHNIYSEKESCIFSFKNIHDGCALTSEHEIRPWVVLREAGLTWSWKPQIWVRLQFKLFLRSSQRNTWKLWTANFEVISIIIISRYISKTKSKPFSVTMIASFFFICFCKTQVSIKVIFD